MRSISIVGTGYVGLSTAVCFASQGYHVIAATQDTEKALAINAKRAPFYEPGLNQLLEKGIEAIRKVSDEEQDRAGELLLQLAVRGGIYRLTDGEQSEMNEALAEVERGEMASEADVAAMKRRYGLS